MEKTQSPNSKSFIMAYDAIKARTALFREVADQHECSIGKFLADVIFFTLDTVYVPVHEDEKLFDKEIQLDLSKNLRAMLKEPQDDAGRFVIRPEIAEHFNEIKSHSRRAVGFSGLSDEEFGVLCDVAQFVRYYENGQLHARLTSNKLINEIIN